MGQASDPPTSLSRTAADTSAAQPTDLTGKTLGDFQILRRLGEGGMGQVYLAEQISLKRKVALKILRADLAANAVSLQRFKAEALAVARATHANIVQVYACDEAEGLHYMALEYVEGRNLRQYLERKGPPEVLMALSIIRQVAAALQRASELGIIHRDIKPENILLTRKGEVKVADFGLSRCFADDTQPLNLTQSGVSMGTPLYMSPEQVEGKTVDPRTDIYSLGVTCYHLFAGTPPFRGQSAYEVAFQHVQKDPQPLTEIRPDLPREVCVLVHKMMAKKPEDRFQTGREIVREASRLRDTLVGVSGGLAAAATMIAVGPAAAPLPSDAVSTQTLPRLPRRRPWLAWAAVLSVVLALGGGLALGWRRNLDNAPPPSPPPQEDMDDPLSAGAREKLLLDRVKHYTDPTSALEEKSGLDDRVNLGLHYLKERRLDEAERFFKQLQQADKVKSYRLLGQLGEAMVLAFRDQPEKSLELFRKVRPAGKVIKGRGIVHPFFRDYGPLHQMVARAMQHNRDNLPPGASLSGLDDLLRPPPPNIKGKGKG
ncbi:MAG TPA: serine/threonine-protein kinase [Gemmataceae bacterium]|nr:serine/threonine-protein kinase [Gemmataceae bacterium]